MRLSPRSLTPGVSDPLVISTGTTSASRNLELDHSGIGHANWSMVSDVDLRFRFDRGNSGTVDETATSGSNRAYVLPAGKVFRFGPPVKNGTLYPRLVHKAASSGHIRLSCDEPNVLLPDRGLAAAGGTAPTAFWTSDGQGLNGETPSTLQALVGSDWATQNSPAIVTGVFAGTKRVLRLNGSTQYLSEDGLAAAFANDINRPYSWVMAGRFQDNGTSDAFIGISDADTAHQQLDYFRSDDTFSTYSGDSGGTNGVIGDDISSLAGSDCLIGLSFDGTDKIVRIAHAGGIQSFTMSNCHVFTPGTFAADTFCIGARVTSGTANSHIELDCGAYAFWDNVTLTAAQLDNSHNVLRGLGYTV